MKKFLIKVNGNAYEVEVEEIKKDTLIKKSKPVREAATKTSALEAASNSTSAASIKAPMPGTILSVNVKVGESVKKGQVLLILEAMKMENELTAPIAGTITAISAEKGKSVTVGENLISIS